MIGPEARSYTESTASGGTPVSNCYSDISHEYHIIVFCFILPFFKLLNDFHKEQFLSTLKSA